MRYLSLIAIVLIMACSEEVPTEPDTALFGVGNAPALIVSDFAIDQASASFGDPLNVTATVQVGHLRGNEYARVRFSLGPIYEFRAGESCREMGYPSGAYCRLAVGLCDAGADWRTRALFFTEPGTYEVSVQLQAGVLCDGLEVSPAEYRYGIHSGIFNSKNEQKYRYILTDYTDFELLD